ncbi:MAG: polysaccharide deacetylase family protein [Bacteroidales bacterium]|nr:polysaccharide deacetylase family protein [Bacteroidales bacterium]
MKKRISLLFIVACLCLVCAANVKPFVHPGMAQSMDDLNAMRDWVLQGKAPWKQAYDNLLGNTKLDGVAKGFCEVFRGPYGANSVGASEFSRDGQLAYNLAMLWFITKEQKYADKAIEILNAWSYKLRGMDGNDAKLIIGLSGYLYMNAAEILRHTGAGWQQKDIDQFTLMTLSVFYRAIEDFFMESNGNWDASMISTMLCIGIFTDRRDIFDRAVNRFMRGERNGGITKYVFPTGQCQETVRDWGHIQLGLGEMIRAAQTAQTQGLDLFAVADDRIARGCEYMAKYLLTGEIELFGLRSDRANTGRQDKFEPLYLHYKYQKGIRLPYVERLILENTRDKSSSHLLGACRANMSGRPQLGQLPDIMCLSPVVVGASPKVQTELPQHYCLVKPGQSVQEAIDQCKGTDKWVVLDEGVHTLKATLKLYSHLKIMGKGRASVLHAALGVSPTITTGEDALTDVEFRNFMIEGDKTIDQGTDPNEKRRERSYMRGVPVREGIVICSDDNLTNDIRFENMTITRFTESGVRIVGAKNLRFNRCDFADNGGKVIPGQGFHHNILLSYVDGAKVGECRLVESLYGCGIHITFSSDIEVTDSELSRNGRHGIYMAESKGIQVKGCRIEGNDREGIMRAVMVHKNQDVKLESNIVQNNGNEMLMALTFDDGPNMVTTPEVLDVLEQYGAKASFFVLGKNINNETAVAMKRAHDMGCSIENHSWTHYHMNTLTPEQVRDEVERTSAIIKNYIGEAPHCFRPPYLDVNDSMFQVIDLPFIGAGSSGDSRKENDRDKRIGNIMQRCTDGSIVGMHDFAGNHETVEALKILIPRLLSMGYKLVTVPELFARKGVVPEAHCGVLYGNTAD